MNTKLAAATLGLSLLLTGLHPGGGTLGSGASPAAAGTLAPELDRALLESPNASKRVIVLMKEPLALRGLRGTPGQIKARVSAQADASQRALRDGLTKKKVRFRSLWIVNGLALTATPELAREIAARPDVRLVTSDGTINLPKEPVTDAQLQSAGEHQWSVDIVRAPEAWAKYGFKGKGVRVGHIDTGCEATHADVAGKLYAWKDFVNGKPEAYDDQGHGTHTVGTILGGNASGKWIGVAPEATIAVAKVFSASGSANTSDILGAMQWMLDPDGNPATDDAPRLVSNSWGSSALSNTYSDAVSAWVAAGIFPSFAAGNSGPSPKTVGTPGGLEQAFAVGATDSGDKIADFSSRGPAVWETKTLVKPEVSAPGKDVTSAWPGGGYKTISGTSMATPCVSGCIAVLLSADPALSIRDVTDVLQETSKDLGAPGKDNDYGAGRVDLLAALDRVVLGGKVAGSVVDAAGKPVSAAAVRIGAVAFETGADGKFQRSIVAGNYTVSVSAFGFRTWSGSIAVKPRETTTIQAKLEAAENAALGGVVYERNSTKALQAHLTLLGTPLKPFVSDPRSGRFTITAPAGSYKVKVTCFKHQTVYLDLAVPGADVKIELDPLPPVLLVADAGQSDLVRFYRDALKGAGTAWNENTGARATNDETFSQYPLVIWFCGKESSDTVSASDQAALTSYLKGGGNLLLTGQDVGYDIKNSKFMSDMLKAKYLQDTATGRTVKGAGSVFGALGFPIAGGDGANNQKYPDVVSAENGGTLAFSYQNGEGTTGGAGVTVETDAYRVLYLAFGFEGIADAASRTALMKQALAFLIPDARRKVRTLAAVAADAGADAAGRIEDRTRLLESELVTAIDAQDHARIARFVDEFEKDPGSPILAAVAQRIRGAMLVRGGAAWSDEMTRLGALVR